MSIKNFYLEDNIITFSSKPADSQESLIKEGRLFYVGTHKGRKYSKDDLNKIAKNFNPEEGVPIQLDHSISARDTVGIVRNIEERGNELFGKMEFLGKDVVDKVRLGLWKKISVGLSIKHPEMKLQEVSITPFPALKNAKIFNDTKEFDNMSKNDKDNEIQMSETDKIKKYEEKFAKINEEKMSLEVKFAQLEKKNEELEKKIQFTNDERIIEKFMAEGKIPPVAKDEELALFNSLDGNQRKLYVDALEKRPKFAEIGRVFNNQEAGKSVKDINQQKEDERAERLASKAQFSNKI